MLNEYLDERERQLEERFAEVQDRVREALGRPDTVPA
jgi:FtsZ-binding cell division protein ZapB